MELHTTEEERFVSTQKNLSVDGEYLVETRKADGTVDSRELIEIQSLDDAKQVGQNIETEADKAGVDNPTVHIYTPESFEDGFQTAAEMQESGMEANQ